MVRPVEYARRSFLHRRLAEHGAVFAEVAGAAVADHYGGVDGEAVGAAQLALVDLSPLPRIGFKGKNALNWMISQGVRGLQTDNIVDVQYDGVRAARLAPSEGLVLCDLEAKSGTVARLAEAWSLESAPLCFLVPRADSHYWFAVTGARAAEMFAKVCGVDLRPDRFAVGAIAQTSVARNNAIIIRRDVGRTLAYDILGDSASADYMWRCLLDAMAEFGGKPAGLSALRRLAAD